VCIIQVLCAGFSAPQGSGDHGRESVSAGGDRAQALHQPVEKAALLVMVAIADAYTPGMPPDLGCQEQEPQPRRRPGGMRYVRALGGFLPLEQQQPAVQVLSQHHDLEPVGVHHPALGRVRCQAGVVVGFLDQVLGRGAPAVEPHQRIQRCVHVRDEDLIGIFRRIEQLVLLGFLRLAGLRLLLIPQRQEAVSFAPALWLVEKLALAVGVGARRRLPGGGLQFVHQACRLARHHNEPA
jgi:hypothetical protein